MKIFNVVAIVLLILRPLSSDKNNDILKKQAIIDKFVHEAPLFIKERSINSIRKLDKIINEISKEEINPHIPNTKIVYKTFLFKGLTISGCMINKKEFSIISIIIDESQWKILNQLDVGSLAARIEKYLGIPSKEYNNILNYCGETECVDFHIQEGKIVKIVLNYYFD